jgi:hypothetical protein
MTIGRDLILKTLVNALEPEPHVLAMFEDGSAAWGREDEWSDTDLNLIVEDDHVLDAFTAIERALESLSPIQSRWHVPEPAWHGFSQRFYGLQNAGPYLFVDVSVLKRSQGLRLPEIEAHGFARVLIDKVGLEASPPADVAALRNRMRAELENIKARWAMFGIMVEKELKRGRPLDALHFYQGMVVRPVVVLLGMRYRPFRFDFGMRYMHLDLPEPVQNELREIAFVSGPGELLDKQRRAELLFDRTLAEIDVDAMPLERLSAEIRASR